MDLIILYRITADLKVETDIITSIADSPITKLSKNTTQHAPDTTTRKQAQKTTQKTCSLPQTTGPQRRTEHRFHVEIVMDTTTRNSERKDK